MNILITGGNGQLGSEMKDIAKVFSLHQWFFTDIDNLDITNLEDITKYCHNNTIDLMINCAAYTQVDKAEQEKEIARMVNGVAVENLVKVARERDIPIIHISTDYVFDGKNYFPYPEDFPIAPLSVYGITKAQGEQALLPYEKGVIIRTAWVYSSYGNNFLKTILRLAKERDCLTIVADQAGTPTYAKDLADVVWKMSQYIQSSRNNDYAGIYHFTNEGICSWYDFAMEIVSQQELSCKVLPITTADYPTPAKRPSYSVLDKTKIKKFLNIEIPHWKSSVKECLKKM